jgi:hypothetical protein
MIASRAAIPRRSGLIKVCAGVGGIKAPDRLFPYIKNRAAHNNYSILNDYFNIVESVGFLLSYFETRAMVLPHVAYPCLSRQVSDYGSSPEKALCSDG